ncbi:MAG: hypothetical protein QNJ45_08215 [Ardenticatenaceae bacterium]|nr:hypothetical protein [Ardenticatenaceae bacterium]
MRPDPIPVTFATLNADPFTFLNRVVRVTAVFRSASPVGCFPFTGPKTSWRMVADGFEMPVNGLAAVAEIAPDGLVVTIDGIWRKYEGPFGCGDEPEISTFWYLEASQLVTPNPLGGSDGQPANQSPINPTPDGNAVTGTPAGQPRGMTPTPSSTPTSQVVSTITPVPTFTPESQTATATPSPTTAGSTTATVTPTGTIVTTIAPTSTGTITVTPTPTPGQGTTQTPEPTSSVGESGSGTRTAATPRPTDTPEGGYPPPNNNTTPYP